MQLRLRQCLPPMLAAADGGGLSDETVKAEEIVKAEVCVLPLLHLPMLALRVGHPERARWMLFRPESYAVCVLYAI